MANALGPAVAVGKRLVHIVVMLREIPDYARSPIVSEK